MTNDNKKNNDELKVVTFGCRLNSYESEVMKDLAKEAGLNNAIVINTCAVTSEAERQARQTIRKLKRENPDATIIVTGCAAQINPETYSKMPEVDRVVGNDEKLKIETYQAQEITESNRISVNDIMSIKETALHLISGFEGKVRAFIQVQNGCNHRCTFCTIPYGRGNSRSVALSEIIEQVRILVEAGYKEIVLTGVDITEYGKDLPGEPTLGQTIKRLLMLVPELHRLRLSSLDPIEVDEDLWKLIENEKRLLPHFHISLQAGDDTILKRMKRRHLRHDVIDFCKKVRSMRPDAVFGADIIAGFPTESEDMFLNTLRLVKEADLTFLHVFPYSPRPGTPAALMPQVDKKIIKDRAKRLREAGEKAIEKQHQALLKSSQEVLIESISDYNGKRVAFGKTNHFYDVIIIDEEESLSPGMVVLAQMVSCDTKHLIGRSIAVL